MSRRTPLLLLLGVLAAAALLLWWPGRSEGEAQPESPHGAEAAAPADAAPASGTAERLAGQAVRDELDGEAAEVDAAETDERTVHLVLLDPGLRPIVDAPLTGWRGNRRTDERGRVPLRLPTMQMAITRTVSVPGYLPRHVEIPGGDPGEVDVVLQPTTLVRVELEPAEGTRAQDYEFVLSLGNGVYLERGVLSGLTLERLLHPDDGRGYVGDLHTMRDWYWEGHDGAHLLSGLPSGKPVHIQLAWRGVVLETRELVPLQPAERRVEHFRPPALPLRHVVAVDEQGQPLSGVLLEIADPSPNRIARERAIAEDEEGGWWIPDREAPKAEFTFALRGRVPQVFRGMPPAQVVLPPLAEFTVHLVMEDGSAAPEGVRVTVKYEDQQGAMQLLKPVPLSPVDAPIFHGLPRTFVMVRAVGDAIEPAHTFHDVGSGDLTLALRPRRD